MICQTLGELPDEIGYILSPIVKIVVMISLFVVFIAMLKKHTIKKQVITRNLSIMIFIYMLAPLFSSFDILLNWEYLWSMGEKTYVGMGFAFLFNAFGNMLYYWFMIEIYYENKWSESVKKISLLTIGALEIGSTSLAMILRLTGSNIYFLFIVIHMLISMYIYLVALINSIRSETKVKEEQFKKRFRNIARATVAGIIMIVLFAIDSLFAGVTIYSLIGWLCLIAIAYFIYKGYI